MTKPLFIFTAYKSSFKVIIKNLEALSVEQIQTIQKFVEKRNGLFDFHTYSFTIQKKLEFQEFVQLVELSCLNGICVDNPITRKVKPRISFGQYKGMLYNELPDSYLLWLKSSYFGYGRDAVEVELKARRL